MPSIPEIREKAARIPDQEMRAVCFQIIDQVAERLGRSNQGMWTYQTFSKWSGRQPYDEILLHSVQLLAAREDARLLDMHFLFFDPDVPDSNGEPIEDQEVADAYKSGYLIHPDSGDEIPDFEGSLAPYFVPSASLVAR